MKNIARKVVPLIKKFGGRYLVRGGNLRRLDGNLPLNRLVNDRSGPAVLRQRRVSADPKTSPRQHAIRCGAGAGVIRNRRYKASLPKGRIVINLSPIGPTGIRRYLVTMTIAQ